MKKTLFSLLFLFICGLGVQAQNFSGTITYHPTVTGENAAMAQAMMPSSYIYKVSDQNLLLKIEGGMMASMMGDFLVVGKKGKSYMIKHAEKKAYLIKKIEDTGEKSSPVITKEDETAVILGHTCQKYKVELENAGMGTMTQYVWAAADLKLAEPKAGTKKLDMGSISIKGIDGIVLKSVTEIMGMTMTNTATDISTEVPSKSTFTVPKGYKVEEKSIEDIMGGMGGM